MPRGGSSSARSGALDHAAAGAALEEPARGQGVSWQRPAVERVIHLTQGYPYFLQEYGRAVWRIAAGASIGLDDVKAAEAVAGEYLDQNFFSRRIGKLPTTERGYLSAIAWQETARSAPPRSPARWAKIRGAFRRSGGDSSGRA